MSCCSKQTCAGKADAGIDDDSNGRDSKRKFRNLSEKRRRDQFNLLVNELGALVFAVGARKLDKSTVLKSTISFLKTHNEVVTRSRVHEIRENWKPSFLTNEQFTHLVLEAVDGFLVVLGSAGNILYISESAAPLLGYIPDDILGMTIYDLGLGHEQNDLHDVLTGPVTTEQDQRPVSFSCHLRIGNYDHGPVYDLVHFTGYFRTSAEADNSSSGAAERRQVFVGTGRLQVPHLINEIQPLGPAIKAEFTSKHSLAWKFLHLDHRASPIIGYLPFELLGTSGYDYYHIDDMDRVIGCHDALMQNGEGTSCCYRFLTKGQQWIWLESRFYITYHQWNSKPEFIVCTHRVVSHIDVVKEDGTSTKSATSRRPSLTQPSTKARTSLHEGHPRPCETSTESSYPQTPLLSGPTVDSAEQCAASSASAVLPTFTNTPATAPTVNHFGWSPEGALQMDLHSKHAELQMLIGQQQAELRRVSEELLMAHLGMLVAPQTQTSSISTTAPSDNNGMVSSTTSLPVPPSLSSSNQPIAASAQFNVV